MQKSLFDVENRQPLSTHASEENQLKISKQVEEYRILLEHISSSITNTLRDKVAWLLNHFPETRDSDISLMIRFWENFDSDIYLGPSIEVKDLYKLTKLTSITRERARIQNVYKLFLASSEVQASRGTLSEEEKERSKEDKPKGWPTLVVYMDESGKDSAQIVVGSLWFLGGGQRFLNIMRIIQEYKKRVNFEKEFHFSEMRKNDLQIYKDMISLFLQEASAIGFKLASVPTAGIENKQNALQELFYHLLIRGVESENQSRRAVLPRFLQIWKDSEEEGADKLLIADLDDRLKQAANSRFNQELFIDEIRCVSSESNIFMQIADLFTGSANRVINNPGSQRNHKDDFAEFFLDSIGVGKTFSPNDQTGDMAIHITL